MTDMIEMSWLTVAILVFSPIVGQKIRFKRNEKLPFDQKKWGVINFFPDFWVGLKYMVPICVLLQALLWMFK